MQVPGSAGENPSGLEPKGSRPLETLALRAQGDIYLLSLKLEIPDGSTGKPRSNPALLPV